MSGLCGQRATHFVCVRPHHFQLTRFEQTVPSSLFFLKILHALCALAKLLINQHQLCLSAGQTSAANKCAPIFGLRATTQLCAGFGAEFFVVGLRDMKPTTASRRITNCAMLSAAPDELHALRF